MAWAFICIFLFATSLTALTPKEQLYELILQNPFPKNPADLLQQILDELEIQFVFPKIGGELSFQSAALSSLELSGKASLFIYDKSLVSVLTRLQERDGSVGVDSLLFAQIAAMLLDGKGNDPKFELRNGARTTYQDLTLLSDRKFLWVVPELEDATRFFWNCGFPYRSSEIWLLDMGDKTFAGMTRSGPRSLTLAEWVVTIRNDIESECQEEIMNDKYAFRPTMLEVLIKSECLNKWEIKSWTISSEGVLSFAKYNREIHEMHSELRRLSSQGGTRGHY